MQLLRIDNETEAGFNLDLVSEAAISGKEARVLMSNGASFIVKNAESVEVLRGLLPQLPKKKAPARRKRAKSS